MEKTKKFRFNIIDAVIIITVIAVIAGLVLRAGLSGQINAEKQEAKITFIATNIHSEIAASTLLDGDEFYSETYECKFGTICDRDKFEITPAEQHNESASGELVVSTLEHRSDVRGYLTAEGYFDEDNGFLLGGKNQIFPGGNYEIYSQNRRLYILIVDIEPVN